MRNDLHAVVPPHPSTQIHDSLRVLTREIDGETKPFPIRLSPDTPQEYKAELLATLDALCERWQFTPCSAKHTLTQDGLILYLSHQGLALADLNQPKVQPLQVDFANESLLYRKDKGGGEAIGKAMGLKKGVTQVIDATAGLGTDSFIMASLGCDVIMLERSNVVGALLEDGLRRMAKSPECADLQGRLSLVAGSAIDELGSMKADAVYLDPMFPHKKKSAAVKKNMQMLQALLGHDNDADALLAPALQAAQQRVVVKRPNYAPDLDEVAPHTVIKGKKHRFDVYVVSPHQSNI